MAFIRLARGKSEIELLQKVSENLVQYRSGDFNFLTQDSSHFIEVKHEFDPGPLLKVDCTETDHAEVACCEAVFESLGHIPPYLARDSRLWTYFTHTVLLKYTRRRWPIPLDDAKAVAHIRKHFFAIGSRGVERDNAVSRLWWMATLCSRVKGLTLNQALTSFLYQYDVRANIIERPTTSQSVPIFSAVIKKLDESLKGDKALFERENFRKVMRALNLAGGVKLLSVLNENEIGDLVDGYSKKGP